MIKKGFAIISVMSLAFAATTGAAGTLDQVKSKDVLTLGVSEGVPGFSAPDDKGVWTGFDVDMGKAVAAAVLGDAGKIKYVPLASPSDCPWPRRSILKTTNPLRAR